MNTQFYSNPPVNAYGCGRYAALTGKGVSRHA